MQKNLYKEYFRLLLNSSRTQRKPSNAQQPLLCEFKAVNIRITATQKLITLSEEV